MPPDTIALTGTICRPGFGDICDVKVSIRAFIDGRSRIKIQDNQLWWQHLDFAAPGRLESADESTIVNGFSWLPVWPFNDEGRGCDCESSKLDLSLVGVQLASDAELLELRLVDVRVSASIVQAPSGDNDFLTILEMNDNPSVGAAWYELVAVFGAGSVDTTTVPSPTVPSSGGGGGSASLGLIFLLSLLVWARRRQARLLGRTRLKSSSATSSFGDAGTWNSASVDQAFSLSGVVVPVPAALWLFGSGLGMLGWIRRRQTV